MQPARAQEDESRWLNRNPFAFRSLRQIFCGARCLQWPVRRYTIAAVGKITPERARARAKVILGAVAHGHDPANQKTAERGTPTLAELADLFMADHVRAKRKPQTAQF